MITTILLVPSPEHREALLGDGACGARVPMMWDYRPEVLRWTVALDNEPRRSPHVRQALVLAHNGKVVREGRDRLGHVFACQRWPGVVRPILGYGTMWSAVDASLFNHAKKKPSQWCLLSEEADDDESFDLPPCEDLPDDLLCVWALGVVCAERGLGTVVLLDSEGREVSRG